MAYYRKRSSARRTYKKRDSRKKTSTYRKKYLPSRIRAPSKANYKIAKEVSRQLNKVAENRFVGVHKRCIQPVPKPGGGVAPATYVFYNSGTDLPTAVDPSNLYTAMELFQYPQSTPPVVGQRIGRYLYVKHSHINFELQMLPTLGPSLGLLSNPVQFRFMCVKQRSNNVRLGNVHTPGDSLFLAADNKSIGYENTQAFSLEFNKQPINKRNWMVYCDKKFILAPPAAVLQDGANNSVETAGSKYPSNRHITMKLPVNKKVLYGLGGEHPLDFDSQWLFIVQAIPVANCVGTAEPPKNWILNYTGTTVANDS